MRYTAMDIYGKTIRTEAFLNGIMLQRVGSSKILLLCAVACLTICAEAQKIVIRKIELVQEKIIVLYDLEDNNPNNQYKISLYASRDKFSTPLTKVTGDVGTEVNPGIGRRIEWNGIEEYGAYAGPLSLEIRGIVFIPFVRLRDVKAGTSFKRGKNYVINWRPGNTNPIHIEWYKGSERVGGELNHPNNGSYSLTIPAKAKPGKNYRLKITDSRTPDEIVYSEYFRVKPKLPWVVKVLPILAVGGVIAALAGGSSSSESEQSPILDPKFPSGN